MTPNQTQVLMHLLRDSLWGLVLSKEAPHGGNCFREDTLLMFGLHSTTSGTHHAVVSTLISPQAAQLDFT